MKIRKGYVSNSSSTSFLLFTKQNIDIITKIFEVKKLEDFKKEDEEYYEDYLKKYIKENKDYKFGYFFDVEYGQEEFIKFYNKEAKEFKIISLN